MSAATGGSKNRLAQEISPYLLLHQSNPVDWYPWGEEALAKAKREDKPIFLSVGYSTCYWCHVMERESFADAGTAALMNEHFVNIKVDREERPELDEIYMAATQIMTHQGGWPNSLFLTPQLKPFFAGTYFPPADRYGRPSFKTVLLSMHRAWLDRRAEVEEQATELADAMRRYLEERGEPAPQVADPQVVESSRSVLMGRFDAELGGFGEAPKFPSPSNLFFLQELAPGDPRAAEMLEATLDAMARGGIYDQLAGGFHRYATDRAWKIPHFEKMLYDNGQLLELYARDYARTGDVERARIVRETVAFLERELSAPEGGFLSAIDAETGGREGGFHAWTGEELRAALGAEDADFLAPIFGFDGRPFFDHDYYVLHLPLGYAEQAARRRLDREALLAQVEPLKHRLWAARERRPKPLVDDKVLTDWNGMVISGLAAAGAALGEPAYLERAARAADFLLVQARLADGCLAHSWRQGEARFAAFLSDYVFLVRGLLALYEATGDLVHLEQAGRLTREQVERLGDPRGGFFLAGESADVLFRSKEIFDGALPATNAVAALNLLDLARLAPESGEWLELAERTLKAFTRFVERQPEGVRMMTIAVRRWHALHGTATEVSAEAVEEKLLRADAAYRAEAADDVVAARLELGPAHDGEREFTLDLEIEDGWHVYAHDPGEDFLLGIGVRVEDGELLDVVYPPGAALEAGGVVARVLQGEVRLTGRVRGARPLLVVGYQACDDQRCLPPAELALA
jgi:uncharacterized protein YyaL (SSP411 family)